MIHVDFPAARSNATVLRRVREAVDDAIEHDIGTLLREKGDVPRVRALATSSAHEAVGDEVSREMKRTPDKTGTTATRLKTTLGDDLDAAYIQDELAAGTFIGWAGYERSCAAIDAEARSASGAAAPRRSVRREDDTVRLEQRARRAEAALQRTVAERWRPTGVIWGSGLALAGTAVLMIAAGPDHPWDQWTASIAASIDDPWRSLIVAAGLISGAVLAGLGIALALLSSPLLRLARIRSARAELVFALASWIRAHLRDAATLMHRDLSSWLSKELERRIADRRNVLSEYTRMYLQPKARTNAEGPIKAHPLYQGRSADERRVGARPLLTGTEWESLGTKVSPARAGKDLVAAFTRQAAGQPDVARALAGEGAPSLRTALRSWLCDEIRRAGSAKDLASLFANGLPSEERRVARIRRLGELARPALKLRPGTQPRLARLVVTPPGETAQMLAPHVRRELTQESVVSTDANRIDVIAITSSVHSWLDVVDARDERSRQLAAPGIMNRVLREVHSPQVRQIIAEHDLYARTCGGPPVGPLPSHRKPVNTARLQGDGTTPTDAQVIATVSE